MTFSGLSFLGFAAIALLFIVRWIWHRRSVVRDRDWLPRELRGANLVYAEQVFRADKPVSIVAKLDRGYRHRNGVITLVELKTRRADRFYLSDVIELSVQRFALEVQTKESVAPYAYVLVQQVGRRQRTAHRVELLTHAAVVALVARRKRILADLTDARYTERAGLCMQCAFKQQCKHRFN